MESPNAKATAPWVPPCTGSSRHKFKPVQLVLTLDGQTTWWFARKCVRCEYIQGQARAANYLSDYLSVFP